MTVNHPIFDLILKNGTAVTPSGIIACDIGVLDGKITELGSFTSSKAKETIDCTGLHILPGVIDTQVHFREPGNTHKEDLESGTKSAIAGGVTSILEMPNTDPLTTSVDALQDKLNRAKGRAFCNYGFFMGGTAQNASQLNDLEKVKGCCGTKIFMGSSTGNLLVSEAAHILDILKNGRRLVAVHAEDENRLKERFKIVENGADVSQHPVWRDKETAILATTRILELARKAKRLVHVLHITTAEEIELLSKNKDIATVEVTPQHLTLSAPDCYQDIGTYAQMNPPIRHKAHQDALWRAINNGVVDIIGSDHAPHTISEKEQPYPKSPSGMPGVQTLVPIMLNHVHEERLTLERFVDLVCHGPNRVHKITGKGRLCVGYDADFTIVDLKAKRTLINSKMKSKSGWTPYDGISVTGWPIMAIIRGKLAMKEGVLLPALGQSLNFSDNL